MSMSRKDYVVVADEFRQIVETTQDRDILLKLSRLATNLSDVFFKDNTRFSSSRFLIACGFDGYGNPKMGDALIGEGGGSWPGPPADYYDGIEFETFFQKREPDSPEVETWTDPFTYENTRRSKR